MKKLYQYAEQARHPYLSEEHYFNKLNPYLAYAGMQSGIPGAQNVLHSHPFVEVVFVWKGKGHIHLNGEDLPVGPGDLLVYNAGQPHCEYSDEGDPLTFYFTAYDKINLPGQPANQLLGPDVPPLLHTQEKSEHFFYLFREVVRELQQGMDFGYEIAQATAKIIVMQMFRLLNQSVNAKDFLQSNRVLQDALRYIDENFTQEISLNLLANECMVSKYHLSHLFTKGMGVSIGRYILEKRLSMAKHLLNSTDLSVEQVSLQSGFADCAYFCRLFKKETGSTPTQFRKK